MSEERREKGLAMLGKLFGTPAGEGRSIPEPLGRYTVEHLFGDVWQQDDLTLQERSLATCTMLFALVSIPLMGYCLSLVAGVIM